MNIDVRLSVIHAQGQVGTEMAVLNLLVRISWHFSWKSVPSQMSTGQQNQNLGRRVRDIIHHPNFLYLRY